MWHVVLSNVEQGGWAVCKTLTVTIFFFDSSRFNDLLYITTTEYNNERIRIRDIYIYIYI